MLDAADVRILQTLQSEGRLSNQSLAERVGMSTSACWRKVKQLEDDGVIRGYGASIDRRKVDLGVIAFIRIKIDGHSDKEAQQFETGVMQLREVVACYAIAGDGDFLLQVAIRDLDAYGEFATTVLRKLPRIKEIQTTFVLKETKSFSGWPLGPHRSGI